MKVIILAGGLGTRLGDYTKIIPKPMIKIGIYPILLHVMNIYLQQGFNDFYIATGYKKNIIQNYFKKFKKNGKKNFIKIFKKKCRVTLVNTGLKTLTGGRLKRLEKFLSDEEDFMFTYGDGLANLNLKKLIKVHKKKKKLITVTAVRPPARFGEVIIKNNDVLKFQEKPQVSSSWINGGFFIAKKNFLKLIKSDTTILEKEPLERATKLKQLCAYQHNGFWKCMDVKRDKDELEKIYYQNKFKWKFK